MTCKCDLRTRAVGDGCKYCNPQDYIDKLEAQSTDDRAELDAQQAEIERLKGQRDRLTGRLKESQSAVKLCLDKFMYTENVRMADKYHQMWTINSGLISEIEAEK